MDDFFAKSRPKQQLLKKFAYKAYNPETKRDEKSENLIAEFRISASLRVVVTGDMIATGTEIQLNARLSSSFVSN